ncbi:MAG: ABC transporter permease subunit [Oscillospiraceae bacterium]|jgi:putative aldouronate transport system permease protein|nr:ABC transporter permease subunit [Oscillospiraceae bacterium]
MNTAVRAPVVRAKPKAAKGITTYLRRYWTLYLLLALPLAYFAIFKYTPIANILIAFKQYNMTKSVWRMQWAKNNGWEFFIKAFSNRDFLYALRNTIMLNMLDLVVGFPAPILLALLLNELPFKNFKRVTQTVAYMPHFLSWIIISQLALQLFAPTNGLVNMALRNLGFGTIPFLNDSAHWVWTYVFLGIWQSVGWNTIIYLAAITGINPELYEAASVDGAGRFRKIFHVTLPGLKPTIVVLLILSLGRILGSDFDRPYALTNKIVNDVSNVISTFVYTSGIKSMQFSLATAVGLFQSVICVIFLLGANTIAERLGERGLM